MNVTATLFGQMITFAILVWFIARFLWGPMTQMLAERTKRIADGLAAAERGKADLEAARKHAAEIIREAKERSTEIITHAEKRAGEVVDEAKSSARHEAEAILKSARGEIEREIHSARNTLREAVAALAVEGASRILEKEVDARVHARLLDDVVARL